MRPLRVGIVGAGPMGRLHARTVTRARALGDVSELVVVADRHRGRAEEVANDFSAEATDDWEAAFARIDAVIVAVPTAAHFQIAKAALEAGLDVLVEKPLAASADEAQQLLALARAGGRILQVGHVEWYNPGWRTVAAATGTPACIEVERLNPPSGRGLDIDVIQDFMLHDLDWVTRYVGEEIVEWTAEGRCVSNPGLDEAEVELVFRSGCRARIRASRVHAERRRNVRIVGREGTQGADLLLPPQSRSASPSSQQSGQDPLEAQWRDFLAAVRTREAPANDAEVGVAALRWVERIQQRIGSGMLRSGN